MPAAPPASSSPHASTPRRGAALVLALTIALVLASATVVAGPAEARRTSPAAQRAAQARAAQVDAAELRAAKIRAGKVRAAKIRAAKIRAGQIRAGQIRAGKIRAGQVRAARIRAGQVRAGRIRAGQVRAARYRAGQARAAKIRAAQVRAGKIRAGRVRAARIRAAHARAAHIKAGRARAAHVRAVARAKALKRARAQRAVAHRRLVRRTQAQNRRLAKARAHRAQLLGVPKRSYVVPQDTYFSFPNRSTAESLAIRDRVLATVQSTWGARRNSLGLPLPGGGTIRMASWSFDDWPMARALVAARNRGVSVQVMAAQDANGDHGSWHFLRKKLGTNLYKPGHPETREVSSFARQCRGSCRGHGGTPHAKYFLFGNVGPRHLRTVVIQSSMNLTEFAYLNQWNHAQVMWSPAVYADFLGIFRQARLGRPARSPYHVFETGNVVDFFFPRPGAKAALDPVMQTLGKVSCTGATAAGTTEGRTRIRIAQYAIYGERGTWIAKRLRALWNQGCDIAIIYSLSSRPVLSILRNKGGRGPIPMRQSVVMDAYGTIVKYNHSKWMTVTGSWGGRRDAAITFSGSANWANLALGSDEQMQRIASARTAAAYNATFAKTWAQRSSTLPTFDKVYAGGRMLPAPDVPEDEPAFGEGALRYLTHD